MKNTTFLILFLLGISFSLFSQNRYYVRAGATGTSNGQSWSDAFTDLQTALQLAQAGDEVWVAEGVYHPTNSNDRTVSFAPASGVQLYGGFSGNENDLSQREWAAHPSVLSGDIGAQGDSTDNSLNVMYMLQPDSNTVLDGFTICHGQADTDNWLGDEQDREICGGGLYMAAGDWEAFATVRNCRFWHNTAQRYGGGVMLAGTIDASVAPRFINCVFEENYTLNYGGGLARHGGSWVERGSEFEACVFINNKAAKWGGGMFYKDNDGPNKIALNTCTFDQNAGGSLGGGAFFWVGKTNPSGLHLSKTVFSSNKAPSASALRVYPNGLS